MSWKLDHGFWLIVFLLTLSSDSYALSIPTLSIDEHSGSGAWKHASQQVQATKAASIYGIGYRISSSFLGFTFIVGLVRLEGINTTTHFACIILALGSLIR